MNDEPPRRGRPKGTGIKDDATLAVIAGLLAKDAELKPTTAIRRAGITDPSVVRRLRDKLKIVPAAGPAPDLPPASRRDRSQRPGRPGRPADLPRQLSISVPAPRQATANSPLAAQPPLPQDTAPRISTSPAALAAQPAVSQDPTSSPALAPAAATPHTPVPDPQLEALRLAAEAAAAMSRLYLHCITFAAQTNPMLLALRGQTIMGQWMASMVTSQIAAPKGLKSP